LPHIDSGAVEPGSGRRGGARRCVAM